MSITKTSFNQVQCSLIDLVGEEYVHSAIAARSWLTDTDPAPLTAAASEKIDFFPESFQKRLIDLLPSVGKTCITGVSCSAEGASSTAFKANTNQGEAPLSALGYYRLAENGRLYLTAKSEHYHVSLGHAFPGYQLLDKARLLGIPNATHNNTRGHITRLLEQELIKTAAGIRDEEESKLASVLKSEEPHILNRVLNLETGSLAVEAGVKMMLSRFHKIQADGPVAKYTDRKPVFLVMGDMDGGTLANYHGTTVITQIMRGMWGELGCKLESCGSLTVRGIKPNDIAGLKEAFELYDRPPYKIAGFLHEIVLMNYAALLLNKEFMTMAYDLCHTHDVPVLVDEIQSCIWSPEIFMYREYNLHPDFVAVGKGMPGGEYAASRILFTSHMDNMAQFGALVTNGQEELAALAYLVTMRWAYENAAITAAVGQHYEDCVHDLAQKYPDVICAVEGRRHMIGIYFHDLDQAKTFAHTMAAQGMDVSVQTYKAGCPPSALTKLPLISGYEVVDFVVNHMNAILEKMVSRSAVMVQ